MFNTRINKKSNSEGIKTILSLSLPSRVAFLRSVSWGTISDIAAITLLALSMWLIVKSAEQPPILYLNFAVVGVRACALSRSFFRYIERLDSHDSALKQLAYLRVASYEKILPLAPGFLEQKNSGEILSRFVRDVDELQNWPLRVVRPVISAILVASLSVITVSFLSIPVAIVLFIFMIISFGTVIVIDKFFVANKRKNLAKMRGELSSSITQQINSWQSLSFFGANDHISSEIKSKDIQLQKIEQSRVGFAAISNAIAVFSAALSSAISILVLISLENVNSNMTIPVFAALVLVPAAVFEACMILPVALANKAEVLAAAKRITILGETDTDINIPEHDSQVLSMSDAQPAINQNMNNILSIVDLRVSRVVNGKAHPAIKKLNLIVKKRDKILISGESGSGKSTLGYALLKFLNYEGQIKLYGHEIKHLSGDSVRAKIGLITQRAHIFNNNLKQNIIFAKPSATDEELWQILDNVGLFEWAKEREGLDTYLGENGANISGGQAQRIAIARALLADFDLLVCDEPSANLPLEQGSKIIRDILDIAEKNNKAVIVISHTATGDENFNHKYELKDGCLLKQD